MALACAMLLSLLPMAVPKAGAASTSTLANVTESYVDASDGTQISKDETYSVTHKERTPQKIADYTYQDYSESVERVYSHKDISYIYGYPDKTVRPDRPSSRQRRQRSRSRVMGVVKTSLSGYRGRTRSIYTV